MSTSPGNRKDPLPVFCFKVQWDLGGEAFFKGISGLTYEQCQMAAGQFMAAGPPPALPISFNCVRLEEI